MPPNSVECVRAGDWTDCGCDRDDVLPLPTPALVLLMIGTLPVKGLTSSSSTTIADDSTYLPTAGTGSGADAGSGLANGPVCGNTPVFAGCQAACGMGIICLCPCSCSAGN